MLQFLTVLVICTLAGAEVDLFIPSFPELQNVFSLTPFQVELTLGANFVAYCVGSLVVGTLGDRYGRRPIILGGLALFILGSFFCVGAISYWHLILGRFLQGAGIAGPAVLAYVVIADTYPAKEQQRILGILNGIVTLAMSFAPVIGSYVNLFFNWRGNFGVLLAMGIIAFLFGFFWIPESKANKEVTLSFKEYKPILRSKNALYHIIGLCFLAVPYWTFIGIAPILYMKDLGVSLQSFGYYQGAMAAIFSVISLLSSPLLKIFGEQKCFTTGMLLCAFSSFLIVLLGLYNVTHPLLITIAMSTLAAGVVFPINVMYPVSLEVVTNAKGRMAAMIQACRLLLTATAIQIASYFYHGNFQNLAVIMTISLIVSFYAIFTLTRKYPLFNTQIKQYELAS